MYRILAPKLKTAALHDITPQQLRTAGIRGIIFDLDNTILEWDQCQICPEILAWLDDLKDKGFKIGLVSNNRHSRVKEIAQSLGIPFVSRALKPAAFGFRRMLKTLGLSPSETAVVGDQLFTDVLGGNRLGLYTIWVDSLSDREFIGTRITRKFERLAVKLLQAKRLLK